MKTLISFYKCKILYFIFLFAPFFLQAALLTWPYGTIHFFGDSHAGFAFTNYKNWGEFTLQPSTPSNSIDPELIYEKSSYHFENNGNAMFIPFGIHWLGPRTMHRVGRDGMNLSVYGVQPHDIAVFVFGEIDVRVHIGKQVYQKNRDPEEVIDTLAKSYVKRIAESQQLLPTARCIILSVIPPWGDQFQIDTGPGSYLATASLEKRVEFTKKLNERLKKECAAKKSIRFFDAFSRFSDPNGILSEHYGEAVHLSPKFNHLVKDDLIRFLLNQ